MSEGLSVNEWQASSLGLANDESSDSWVAFTISNSVEMGNVYSSDAASNSQWPVSKRTPEILNLHIQITLKTTQNHKHTPSYSFIDRTQRI